MGDDEFTPNIYDVETAWAYHRHPGQWDRRGMRNEEFRRWLATYEAEIRAQFATKVAKAILAVDKSPAVIWAGKGGAKEVLIRELDRLVGDSK